MNSNKGFIKAVIVILIAIVILGFVFNISVIDIINNPKVRESVSWIWRILKIIWDFVRVPLSWVWDNFFVRVWNAVQDGLNQD